MGQIEVLKKAEKVLQNCFDQVISPFDEKEELDRLLTKLVPLICNSDNKMCGGKK